MVIIGKASPRRMELKIYKERDRGSVGGEGCMTLDSIRYGDGEEVISPVCPFCCLKRNKHEAKKGLHFLGLL